MKKTLTILFILILISGCSRARVAIAPTQVADTVLLNGNIYTVNKQQPWGEAVAVLDGKIVYVGNGEGVNPWIGAETEITDLGGRLLLPGFVDAHSHIFLGGAHMDDLILDRDASIEQWLKDLNRYDNENPDKKMIIGSGFLSSTFGAEGPNKELLDQIVSDKPVFIMDEGMHGAWLNSEALKVLAIDKNTPDPSAFDYYKRDARGNPTGYILEGTVWQSLKVLNAITLDSVTKGTAKVIDLYNQYGITSVFDAGPWDVKTMQLDILKNLEAAGDLSIRFQGSQYIDDVEDKDSIVAEVLRLKKETEATHYPIDVLKIMVDGTVEGQTAAMFSAYQDDTENFGVTVFTPEELNALVLKAVSSKLDVHFHALGERAISESLDAIELAEKKHPLHSSRFTISHIQVMADKDITRMAKLGVIAQGSLLWAYGDVEGEKFLTSDQFQRYYRYKSLLDAGVKLTFGCDFPSHGGGLEGVAPLFNMEVGHTRQQVGDASALVQPRISERLSIAELIEGYTLGGAYQIRLEDKIGSIEVGKYADFVLLDKDLFEVDAYSIHKVKVLKTWLGGDPVYQRH